MEDMFGDLGIVDAQGWRVSEFSAGGVANGLFKITNGIWPQVVAWVIGTALSVDAYFAGLIEMGQPEWLGVVMLCVVVGLSSNGIYDIPAIKAWVDAWFAKKPTTSTAKKKTQK